jgi:hypothetical protein
MKAWPGTGTKAILRRKHRRDMAFHPPLAGHPQKRSGGGKRKVRTPRGIHRFSTSSGHPEALDACTVGSWRLPRPDLHRLEDDDFSGHTSELLGMLAPTGQASVLLHIRLCVDMDGVFKAVADSTRRRLLAQLRSNNGQTMKGNHNPSTAGPRGGELP